MKCKKAAALLFGTTAVLAAAGVKAKQFNSMTVQQRADACSGGFKRIISGFGKNLPDPPANAPTEREKAAFSDGLPYISVQQKGARWSLGYSSESILPDDWDKKLYCIAGNTRLPANYATGVLNDIRVRCFVLSDGSGRGAAAFAVLDCIGLSNKNVRIIRDMLSGFMKENGIASVNVFATHTHSSIDTQGIWGPIVSVFKNNRKVLKSGVGELKNSYDEEYIQFVRETVCRAVRAAFYDMTPGRLYKAQIGKSSMEKLKKDEQMTVTERGLLSYVWDRREPLDCSGQLLRLRFKPDDKNKHETVIVNFGAHPYIDSMKAEGKGEGDRISGDFVYSLANYIEKSGANAVYINGAVAAVYPRRLYSDRLPFSLQAEAVGKELARVTLAMTVSNSEIMKNPILNPDAYEAQSGLFEGTAEKSAYRDWLDKKGGSVAEETEIAPILNLSLCEVPIKVDNPIFSLIAKLRIGDFNLISDGKGNYSSFTEIGLLSLGKGEVNAALIPGELEPAVLSGSAAVKAKGSFSHTDFSGTPLKDILGDENLTVFGLANDAIGYIIPDNDFSMMFLGASKRMKKLFGNHYLEIFSFGKYTAAALTEGFGKLCEQTRGSKKS